MENWDEENVRFDFKWLLLKESSHLKCWDLSVVQTQGLHLVQIFNPSGEMPESKGHDEDKDSVPEGELTKFSQMTLKELLSSIYSPLLFFSVFSTIVFLFLLSGAQMSLLVIAAKTT